MDTPVTNPDVLFTVQCALLLLHVPLPIPSVSVVVPAPAHTELAPLIALPPAIVSTCVFVQPAVVVSIIVVVPLAIPDITPDEDPIVAFPVLLLDHVPPVGVAVTVVITVLPAIHAVVVPVIIGTGFIVTTIDWTHPETV